jgi:hypothetical protein
MVIKRERLVKKSGMSTFDWSLPASDSVIDEACSSDSMHFVQSESAENNADMAMQIRNKGVRWTVMKWTAAKRQLMFDRGSPVDGLASDGPVSVLIRHPA